MKTQITKDGQLFITAETELESYALKQFYKDNFDETEKQLSGSNIFFDWTVHPAPACTWAHHIKPCPVCGGDGLAVGDVIEPFRKCCNCVGTGNVWV